MTNEAVRLQKFLARAGVASRRASEQLIVQGRVAVNGSVVTELGTKVNPDTDIVTVDGDTVTLSEDQCVLMLHKPAGYLTAMKEDRGRRCVAQLVPTQQYPGLFPVGRLDFDTTGLLLFTTDGELGNALLHPSFHVDKEYHAWVEGRPNKSALLALRNGVKLQDGMTAPAQVSLVKQDANKTLLSITIHEGRKRQVKRMCAAVGHPVVTLHRSKFGPLELGNLPVGKYRILNPDEVQALKASIQAQ
ncbi:MAG TPA: rRNA pseudouridine synthase [Eggerthellaceae bacterium]|nr:rRNA pseudouridine synthase [Eggerthellaceae bacterium]